MASVHNEPPPSDAPDDRLDAVRARRAAITNAPDWWVDEIISPRHDKELYVRQPKGSDQFGICHVLGNPEDWDYGKQVRADAEFIAHAPADIDYLLSIIRHLRSDFAALEDRVRRMGENLTQDWIDMIDSAPPPTEPQALIWHQWCDKMLRDYAALCKRMVTDGDGSDSAGGEGE